MPRQKCTTSLRQYGFCGVLAVIYAADLPMPKSKIDLTILLIVIQQVLGFSPSWRTQSVAKKRGALSFENIIQLLAHYKCKFATQDLVRNTTGNTPTLNKWLKGIEANSKYIVLVRKHAMFLETKKCKSKWRLYDQGGVRTKGMALRYGAHHITKIVKVQ